MQQEIVIASADSSLWYIMKTFKVFIAFALLLQECNSQSVRCAEFVSHNFKQWLSPRTKEVKNRKAPERLRDP